MGACVLGTCLDVCYSRWLNVLPADEQLAPSANCACPYLRKCVLHPHIRRTCRAATQGCARTTCTLGDDTHTLLQQPSPQSLKHTNIQKQRSRPAGRQSRGEPRLDPRVCSPLHPARALQKGSVPAQGSQRQRSNGAQGVSVLC